MKNKTMIVIGALFIIICLAVTYIMFGKNYSNKAKTTQYLNSRYNKNFVVNDAGYSGGSIGGDAKGYSKLQAYPKDGSTEVFEVLLYDNGKFEDGYIQAFWSKQATELEKKEVGKLLQSNSDVKIEIDFRPNIDGYVSKFTLESVDPKNIIRYSELVREYKNDIRYVVNINASVNGDSVDTNVAVGEIYKIAELIRSKSMGYPELVYSVKSKSARYVCNMVDCDIKDLDINRVKKCLNKMGVE